MSMRPLLYPVRSIRPLIDLVGSRDSSAVEKIVQAYRGSEMYDGGSVDDVRAAVTRVVNGEMSDRVEPGDWSHYMDLAVIALGLGDGQPINDDWKWAAWLDYLELLEERLPETALTLLGYLVMGRPLKGESVENNGSYHAWLTSAEIATLMAALEEVQEEFPEIEHAVEDFHGQLLDWLSEIGNRDVLLLAS
jgi:hypothetical protein